MMLRIQAEQSISRADLHVLLHIPFSSCGDHDILTPELCETNISQRGETSRNDTQ